MSTGFILAKQDKTLRALPQNLLNLLTILITSMHNNSSFNWKIIAEAGHGVMLASQLMAKIAKRHGLQAFNYLEYPSLIRGGHQTGQVYADAETAASQQRVVDVMVIYTQDSFAELGAEITDDTLIIYNSSFGELPEEIVSQYQDRIFQMPLSDWAKEITDTTLSANIVALGVSAFALGLDAAISQQVIVDAFAAEKIAEKNKAAFEHGFAQAKKLIEPLFAISPQEDKSILLTGNEAVGLGALAAGMQFYSAYPMTPATGLLHFLNKHKHKMPVVVKQPEDEIGAINQAIGASIAGLRAMTGSSGGGFALKVESLPFAGIAEVPLVVLEAQRTGPATGVPTWTAQSDLKFVLTAGHGDFPKVVLAPGTVKEHFEYTKIAFYLAEKYQLPVIIISDKYILESHQTMPAPEDKQLNQRQSMTKSDELNADEQYLRYLNTEDGISNRTIPGQEHGLYLANSYEHEQWGFATEDAETIKQAVDKRERKIETLTTEIPQPKLLGPQQAEITLVGWGSTANVFLQLLALTKETAEGLVNMIHIPCLLPFPKEGFLQLADEAEKLIMVEGNVSGQGESWIRQHTGVEMDDHIRVYDGRPFYAEDLLTIVKNKAA